MVIPDVETVGGFSMCSSPYLLESEQTLELAVKYSQHPPAHWVHTQVTGNLRSLLCYVGYLLSCDNFGIIDCMNFINIGVQSLLNSQSCCKKISWRK